MDLPIRFPTQTEVIDEEVARFRALSPAGRLASIQGLLSFGQFLMERSDKANVMRQLVADEESRTRQSVREFMTRHG